MKLKKSKATIIVSYKTDLIDKTTLTFNSCFIILAVSVNEKQALSVSKILFDNFYDHKIVSIDYNN